MWLSRTPLPGRSSLGVLWPATVLSAVAARLASLLISRGIWGKPSTMSQLGSDSLVGGAPEGVSFAFEPTDGTVFVDGSCTDPTCRTLAGAGCSVEKVTKTRAEYGNSSPPSSTLSTRLTSSPIVLGILAAGSVMFRGRRSLAARWVFGVHVAASKLGSDLASGRSPFSRSSRISRWRTSWTAVNPSTCEGTSAPTSLLREMLSSFVLILPMRPGSRRNENWSDKSRKPRR